MIDPADNFAPESFTERGKDYRTHAISSERLACACRNNDQQVASSLSEAKRPSRTVCAASFIAPFDSITA